MSPDDVRFRALIASPNPLNWVLTGDSITHGLVHTQGARSYPEHLQELIRGDLRRFDDAFVNTARSGARLEEILDDFDRRVGQWSPQIVTLMIGTNDCSDQGAFPVLEPAAFAGQVDQFVTRARGIGAMPVLQSPPMVDSTNAPERARIGEFAQAIRDVAKRQQAILVDHFARFEQVGAGGVPWAMMSDPFHPNATGHAAIALEFAERLGVAPARSRVLPRLRGCVEAGRPV